MNRRYQPGHRRPQGGSPNSWGRAEVSSRLRTKRPGVVLVAVLICLLVASILTASLVRRVILFHRQLRLEQYSAQSELLAQAGLARGLRRLRQDPAYSGEVWTVSGDSLGTGQAGVVTIRRLPNAESRNRPTVSAEAVFPNDASLQARCVKQLQTTLQPGEPES